LLEKVGSGTGKILQFRKIKQKIKELNHIHPSQDELDEEIGAIVNDHSLTPANRRWLLENMLMDLDDRLEDYKRELDLAERKLEALVRASEREIEAAYSEYFDRVTQLTHCVKNLTQKHPRHQR